jgi:cysteine desulfurase
MIYLDYNATTPVLPEVLEAVMPYFTTEWGNPSSTYKFGYKIKTAIETAREQVAELIGAHPIEVIFTSCATESNNTAIHAALKANPSKRHIVTSAVEHSSVLNYCKALEAEGYRVTYLPVDREGLLKLADLKNAITGDTAIVSLMWANNETGVFFPAKEIAEICQSRGVLTATPYKPPARLKSTSEIPRSITSLSPATSFTLLKALVRCTSGARVQCLPSSMAVIKNITSVAERKAFP